MYPSSEQDRNLRAAADHERDRRHTSERREHAHRLSTDRRTGDLPRLIDREAACDAVTQALAVGEALAAERIRVAAEYRQAIVDTGHAAARRANGLS